MDLTLADKNELLKAAVKSTDGGIARWLVSIVDQFDTNLADGKRNVPCPPYISLEIRPGTPRLMIPDGAETTRP
jgi:hypothetical protein